MLVDYPPEQEQKTGGDGEWLSLRQQTALLSLNRSSLYYRPKTESATNQALTTSIGQLYQQHPVSGRRRLTAVLRRQGNKLNPKRVRRLMQNLGVQGTRPQPNLSKRKAQAAISPYLLRGVKATANNAVWGIDITYIPLHEPGRPRRYVYKVSVIDWHSRYVISWQLEQSLALPFVLEAVKQAMAVAKPGIWGSDQGSHFTSQQ